MIKLVPIYPWPVPSVVQTLLDPIEDINVVEAIPGGPGPVLAIRKPPPFACDAVVVMNPEALPMAVKLVASEGVQLHTVRDFVSDVFGQPMEERVEK